MIVVLVLATTTPTTDFIVIVIVISSLIANSNNLVEVASRQTKLIWDYNLQCYCTYVSYMLLLHDNMIYNDT